MYLALQITGPQAARMGANASKVFGERGGSIGRVEGNDWVLPDEERFISSRHVIIRYMGGMFSLEDVSTNGTLINGEVSAAVDPIVLKSGDQIQVGDYQIYVNVVEGENDALTGTQEQIPDVPQYADPVLTSPPGMTSPPIMPGASTIGPVDPLDLLGEAPVIPQQSAPPAYSDHGSALSEHFTPPGIHSSGGTSDPGGIPDDFMDDLTGFSSPSAPSPAANMPAPMPPPVSQGMPPNYSGAPAGQGTGVASGGLADQLMPMIVQGMMDVLQSRAEVKSQFRLSLTTIKPRENNPLKFSPNAEDAMRHLFSGGTSGYLNPAEAFEEGFNDIKAHQLAMIAGMRAAFEHMLEQFSPKVLEDYFQGGSKRGMLIGMANKVRYWDMYREMFDRMTRDSDDNFRKLFGEEFASAYEEQMHKIATGR